MKILALALLLALAGCENDIDACARACNRLEVGGFRPNGSGKRMLRYSQSEGCVCEDGEKKQ